MTKKKICFIAQFPPPIHGLSKAIETLYNSDINDEFEFEKVDITNNMNFIKNLKLIRNSKADLFYFTISQTKSGNLRDLVILKLLSFQKKRCLIHLHGGFYRQLVDDILPTWQKEENFKVISKLEGAIVLSESLKKNFSGMISEERIHVVKNCVDDEFLLTDAEVVEKLVSLKNKQVIHVLYLSNFIRTKGYVEVLKLAQLEKNSVLAGGERQFHFDFAGKFFEDTEKAFFENYIKDNGLEEYITYHGIVGGKEKRYLLKLCDLFVLLTRYPNEGQPISILEAMGNAMMIVTTDHAGIPDIVDEGVNGIIVTKLMTVEDVYQKMLSYSSEQLADVNARNRLYCKTEFTQRKYVRNLGNIFSELTMYK